VSGTGLSGVIESTLTAIIFSENFSASDNAEVKIVTPGIYPSVVKFYIQKREKSGDKIKLICRSRIHSLDCPSDFVDDDFDEDDMISTQTVLSRIAALGDFGMTYQNPSVLDALPILEKSLVKGKNCLTLLENIAKALFCTFREYDGNLRLCPFEQVFSEISDAELISPIKTGFNKTINKIILTNKSESYQSGFGGISQTVKIETPFASESLVSSLTERLGGHIYKPFTAMVKTVFIPSATALVTLDEEPLYANDIKVYIKKSGLFAKISCKAVSEDEWTNESKYESEIERKLNEKIAVGERFDALLTESKDLVGALNELFIAAPGGGDLSGWSDLVPYIKGLRELYAIDGGYFPSSPYMAWGVYNDSPITIPPAVMWYKSQNQEPYLYPTFYVFGGDTPEDMARLGNYTPNMPVFNPPTSGSYEYNLSEQFPDTHRCFIVTLVNTSMSDDTQAAFAFGDIPNGSTISIHHPRNGTLTSPNRQGSFVDVSYYRRTIQGAYSKLRQNPDGTYFFDTTNTCISTELLAEAITAFLADIK
jgi:hypothetical protein